MTTTAVRGNQRREQILATAMEMFGEVGYRGTSLRDIATRVGITHPGLLYHFHSKEELLQAVLQRRDDLSNERFNLLDASDPLAQVHGMMTLMAVNVSAPGMIELFSTLAAEATDPSHPAHDYFKARYKLLVDEFARTIEQARDAGLLKEGSLPCARSFAIEYVALIEGLQVQWLYDRDIDIVRILVRRINDFLIEPLDEETDWLSFARMPEPAAVGS